MIATIVRKELLEMRREGRLRWAAVIVLTLLIGALGLGVHNYRETRSERQTAQAADRDNWLAQGEKNPHIAAHFGRYAIKPETALSLLDRGVNQFVGTAVWMEAHFQDSFRFRPAEDATGVARFGALTAAMALQLLVPLLIILLAFTAFAGERERGTLRQLLSLGVPRRTLLFGKALGVAAGLALLLVPAAIIGAGALALTTSGGASGAMTASRFVLLLLAYLLYFGAIVSLTLAVSAWARHSRTALVALLGLWIAGSLLAPRIAVDVAQTLYPAPHYTDFWARIAADADKISWRRPNNEHAETLKRQTLARYGVTKVEDLPVNYGGIELQDGEEYGNRLFDEHYGALYKIYDQQNRVNTLAGFVAPLLAVRSLSMGLAGTDFNRYRYLSPAVVMQEVVNDLAGTGRARHDRFVTQTRSYFDRWRAFITPLMFRRVLLTSADYDRIPRFTYNEEPFSPVVRRTAPPLAAMTLLPLALGWLGLRGLRRYPVAQ